MGRILQGDGSFKFVAAVEGTDLVVENVVCTFFGGDDDPQDNGETASGVLTKGHPNLLGCSLPMDGFHHPSTNGSPIPKLPWKTPVLVTNLANQKSQSFELIDLGPSKFAASHAALDLTKAAFKALGGSTNKGTIKVNYRIVGGAKFVHVINNVSLTSSERFSEFDGDVTASAAEEDGAVEAAAADTGHGSENPHPKPAVKKFIQSPNFSSRNGVKIDTIVLHCTESATAQSAINQFLNSSPGTSAHYIVDTNGDIYQMVADSQRANHCKGANANSIGIEHAGTGNNPLTGSQRAATVKLILFLRNEYGVKSDHIFGHDFTPNRATDTSCPDKLFGPAHTQATVKKWLTDNGI